MQAYDTLYIGGEWIAPSTSATLEVISPFTEECIATVPEGREADVDRAVAAARRAFDDGPWPRMAPAERADQMAALSAVLARRHEEIATAISTEMGCPIAWSRMGQALAAIMVLDTYVGLARALVVEETRPGMLGPVVVRQEPAGVAGAIVPWNFPLFIIMLKLGPALAAGCTIVIKPAPGTPLDAYILAEACHEVGLPPGVVNVVPAENAASEHLVRHPDVDMIGFTGSTAVGRRIGALCGEQLKRVTLELGGKSAAIVLDDADLATVAPNLVPAGILNTGQACGAQTRILVPQRRYAECVDALTAAVAAMVVGDPLDDATTAGPLVSARQRERVEGYIKIGRDEGARIATGGGRPKGLDRGWFVEPTLFADVDNRMRIAREEIFGPVLAVIPYEDEADAVRIANDSDYGLSGSVWTADAARGLAVARQVRTGTYNVNGFTIDFGAPFGGYKCSGIGRELGPEGLREYIEPKSIALFGS
jgi:betaine-aldehyde dehydrogenase